MFKLLIVFILSIQSFNYQNHTLKCEVKTSIGNFVIELFPDKAPITTENFLKYVDAGLYNGTDFFRVQNLQNQDNRPIKIEVIQGGNVDSAKSFPPIHHENTTKTGLFHKDGTLSMARSDTGTTRSSFFICINDQPELDFGGKRNPDGQGFAAFGKVVEGMDVIRKIYQQPFKESAFTPKIMIISISRKG